MYDDLINQMRDLQQPDAVSWWPLAPGWWALLTGLLVLLAALGFTLWRRHQKNRYRRAALAELEGVWQAYQHHPNDVLLTQQISHLLRRTAVTAYPREAVSRLTGQAWLEFLDHSMGGLMFTEGIGGQLASAAYRPSAEVDAPSLRRLAQEWIEGHRPLPELQEATP